MSDVLSDDDVFGSPAKSGVMSDADVFGAPASASAPSPPISGNNTTGTFADGVFLPRPAVSESAMPFVNSTTTGGIMKAFGQEFDQSFGPEQLGISKEDAKWLSKIGIFAPEGQSKYQNPFQAFNEGVMVNTAAFLDGVIRTANAAYRGAQAAGVEAGLPKDVVSIPDAFMGSPHPTGMFKQPTFKELLDTIKEPRPIEPSGPEAPTFTGQEVHPTEIPSPTGVFGETERPSPVAQNPPTFADLIGSGENTSSHFPLLYNFLDEASELGVIGPDKPVLADMADKPVAEAVDALRPKPDDAPKQPPAASDGGWRDRFENFVGKLTQPEEIRQLIRDSADENDNFSEAQQGRITLGDAQNLADAAGMDVSEVDRDKLGGELMTPSHVDRAMQVMIQATRNVKDAARDVVSDASEENLIKFQEHLLRRDMAVETIVGIRSNWGRVGNVLNSYLKDVKDGDALDSFIKETCPL